MKSNLHLIRPLLLLALLSGVDCFAQDNEAPDANENAPESTAAPTGQAVEINEDNYRQFMELRDARQRRNVLPENAFKPQSGLQKMDDLPEASQKHLRNQLREIIVQGDEWQPGDEGTVFPYVPSEAARDDPELQNKEAEAWGELVDSYHKREAEIHANASRTEAAMASMDPAGGGQGQVEGQQSSGNQAGQSESGMAEQSTESGRSGQGGVADSYSPGASDPNSRSTAGVSQNAMEFIRQQMNQAEGTNSGNANTPPNNIGTGQAQTGAGEQPGKEQPSAAANSPASALANNAGQSESTDADGVSQNAMEFLSGSANQAGEATGDGGDSLAARNGEGPAQSGEEGGTAQQPAASESVAGTTSNMTSQAENAGGEGVSQNAMEFLAASTNESGDGSPSGSDGGSDGDEEADGENQDQAASGTAEQQARNVNITLSNASDGSGSASADSSAAGTSQNALEYLLGGNSPTSEGQGNGPGGTLSIHDLLNAQGTLNPGGAGAPPPDADDQDAPGEKIPEKDGGG
ncbi:MAG: hypothetical protein KJO80_06960 [Gammaproteobacteria bacterium]|nr:hypothetical protein [Gammaproteobacteria bacterium]